MLSPLRLWASLTKPTKAQFTIVEPTPSLKLLNLRLVGLGIISFEPNLK